MKYGTIRTQIVMDYDDFTRVLEEVADKVVSKVVSKMKAAVPAPQEGNNDELLTAYQPLRLLPTPYRKS